jgi:hypothetical protein
MRPRIKKREGNSVIQHEEIPILISDDSETNRTQLSEAYNSGFEIIETDLVSPEPQLVPDEKLEILGEEFDYKPRNELEYIINKTDAYNVDPKI